MTMAKQPGKRDIAWNRIWCAAVAVIVSAVASTVFGDRLTNGADVLSFIATIFSILAGVLIAVISILGDPSMLLDQSWRHSYLSATETQRKIHRQTDIFIVYVLLLISLFVFLLADPKAASFWYIQHATFFLTVLAFIASLTLPYSLKGIQKMRLDKAIEQIRGK